MCPTCAGLEPYGPLAMLWRMPEFCQVYIEVPANPKDSTPANIITDITFFITPSFLCSHSISTACASADGSFHVCLLLSKIHAKNSGQNANSKRPHSFSQNSFLFSVFHCTPTAPAAPHRPPRHPPHPAIGLVSGFPFSRKPETRSDRAGQGLRISPVLSKG